MLGSLSKTGKGGIYEDMVQQMKLLEHQYSTKVAHIGVEIKKGLTSFKIIGFLYVQNIMGIITGGDFGWETVSIYEF